MKTVAVIATRPGWVVARCLSRLFLPPAPTAQTTPERASSRSSSESPAFIAFSLPPATKRTARNPRQELRDELPSIAVIVASANTWPDDVPKANWPGAPRRPRPSRRAARSRRRAAAAVRPTPRPSVRPASVLRNTRSRPSTVVAQVRTRLGHLEHGVRVERIAGDRVAEVARQAAGDLDPGPAAVVAAIGAVVALPVQPPPIQRVHHHAMHVVPRHREALRQVLRTHARRSRDARTRPRPRCGTRRPPTPPRPDAAGSCRSMQIECSANRPRDGSHAPRVACSLSAGTSRQLAPPSSLANRPGRIDAGVQRAGRPATTRDARSTSATGHGVRGGCCGVASRLVQCSPPSLLR